MSSAWWAIGKYNDTWALTLLSQWPWEVGRDHSSWALFPALYVLRWSTLSCFPSLFLPIPSIILRIQLFILFILISCKLIIPLVSPLNCPRAHTARLGHKRLFMKLWAKSKVSGVMKDAITACLWVVISLNSQLVLKIPNKKVDYHQNSTGLDPTITCSRKKKYILGNVPSYNIMLPFFPTYTTSYMWIHILFV